MKPAMSVDYVHPRGVPVRDLDELKDIAARAITTAACPWLYPIPLDPGRKP